MQPRPLLADHLHAYGIEIDYHLESIVASMFPARVRLALIFDRNLINFQFRRFPWYAN